MPGLSSFTTRPLIPSAFTFFKTLGRQGAFIQAAEVALRHFEVAAPADPAAFEKFFNAQASKYRLAIGADAFHDARKSAAKWYLVEIYQVWDTFTKALRDEYRIYKRLAKWKAHDNGATLTAFQQLLLNLPRPNARQIETKPEFHVLEYYLSVRNWIIHPTTETARQTERDLKLLLKNHSTYLQKKYAAVHAPNPTSALSFDDHMLFSRALVMLTPVINDACDLQNEEIERLMIPARKRQLRDRQMPKARIRRIGSAFFTLYHGVNAARRNEFADYVLQRFTEGHYSK